MFVKTNFFFVVSTIAYLVINTSRGFSKVVAIAVEKRVLRRTQMIDGPAKYLMTSKLWNWMAVYKVLQMK